MTETETEHKPDSDANLDQTTEGSAAAVVESFTTEKKEEHERAERAQSLKSQLERAAKEHRIHIDIYGVDVPMREPDMEDLITLAEVGERLDQQDPDEDDGDLSAFKEQFSELFDSVTHILAEYNDSEEVALDDPEWWDELLGFSTLQGVIGQLLNTFEDSIDPEDVEEFRPE